MRAATEEMISVNGTALWTVRQGEGVPVVLCHGGPGGYDDLGPAAAMLEDLAAVHRYDQRGCGRSLQDLPYDLDTYLADLDGLRAHWGYATWVVGGHSWGANLALAYALRYPDRVAGLLYLCGTGIDDDWHQAYRVNRRARLSTDEWEQFQALRAKLKGAGELDPIQYKVLDAAYHRLYMFTDFADRRNIRSPAPEAPAGNHAVNELLNQEWKAFAATVSPEQLAALTCPALFVHGEADPRPSLSARRVAAAMPNATFVELEGVGHYAYLEEPYRLKHVLRGFLT